MSFHQPTNASFLRRRERRTFQRRAGYDRRDMIRFSDQIDRRVAGDRRRTRGAWNTITRV